MFLIKAGAFLLLSGSIFAASAYSTVAINKVINKSPVPYTPSSEEPKSEEEEKYTHQELFAEKLTTFGNLEANITVDIANASDNYTIAGYAFVSLETLTNPELYVSLNTNLLNYDLSLEATYKGNNIYTNINGTKLKISTSDISDTISLITSLLGNNDEEDGSLLGNINTFELLNRLSNMSAEEKENYIEYRCDLLDNFPTIVFTSDYDYNFTGLHLNEIALGDFTVSLDADVNVLGHGHNEVKVPEDKDAYVNVKSYLNVVNQVKGYIDNPAFDISYNVKAYTKDNTLMNLSGNGAINLNNGVAFDVNTTLASDYLGSDANINLGYQDHKAYFSYGDIKGYIDDTKFNEIASKFSSLIPSDTLDALLESTNSISLPVIDLIKTHNYETLLAKYHGLTLTDNSISLTLSNTLFSNNYTDVNITLSLDENGLKKLNINNLAYNEYHFDIELELNEYKGLPTINFDEYFNAQNYLNITDQVASIIQNKNLGLDYKATLNMSDELYVVNGHLDADINDLSVVLNGNVNNNENNASFLLGYKDHNIYLNYQDIVKLMLNESNINEIIGKVIKYVNIGELSTISLNEEDLFNALSFFSIDENGINLVINDNINILVNVNENGLENIEVNNITFGDNSLSLELELSEYQNYEIKDEEYIDISSLTDLVDDVMSIIKNKQIDLNLNLEYKGLSVRGVINAKLLENDFTLYSRIVLNDGNNNYCITVEKDDENIYLDFDNHQFILTLDSFSSIINDIKGLIEDKESVLYHYLEDFDLSFSSIDIKDLIFNLPLSSIVKTENGTSITLDNGESFLINIKDGTISVTYNELNASISFNEFEERNVDKTGGWIGASDISNAVHYFSELSTENQIALVEQIKSYTNVDNLSLGVGFAVKVTRDNKLTFNSNGNIDLKNTENGIKVNFNGSMVNNENEDKLNTFFDISYLNDTIYFNYNNSLKISYEKSSILDLVEIISTRLPSVDGLEGVVSSLLPDVSTLASPLFTYVINEDYLGLLNYYRGCYQEGNNLVIVLDASILGDVTGDLSIYLDASNNGLRHISINNIYAFGYVLDFDLSIRDYEDFTIDTEGFTTLNYMNDIIETLADLIKEKQYALTLAGSVKTGDENISFNGSTQFTLGDFIDRGIGKITITDSSNRNHNVTIDVTRHKVDDDASTEEKKQALKDSDVLFSYNNNLKGSFNLGSLSETYELLLSLVDGNKRVNKYKDLLTADFSHSVINEVLNGNIEAILYQNLINNISRSGNNYVIELDGSFLKKNVDIDVENIVITINCDSNNKLKGISIRGSLIGIDIDLTLSLKDYDSSYKGLTKDNTYFDFSDMGTLVKYLLNTAAKDDFTLEAAINLSILGDMNMKGYVHIQDDEKVYAKVVISDIPYIVGICEEIWSDRTATIYFTDDEIYMDVSIIYNGFLGIGKKNISKHMKVTLSEFGNDIVNYLLNYCIGINTDRLSSFTKNNDHVIDLSKVLTSYNYSSSTPSWALTIDMDEVSGISALGDLNVTIKGDKKSELLKSATGEMSLIGLLNVSFNGTVKSYDYIGDEMFGSIINYILGHKGDILGHNYETGR